MLAERRCKVYRVNPSVLLDYLRRFKDWPCHLAVFDQCSGPPEGAELVEISFSDSMRCFHVLVFHPSFPMVAEGECFPMAEDWVGAGKKMRLLSRGDDGAYRIAGEKQSLECITLPTSGQECDFYAEGVPVLQFERGGRVLVRGEVVDDNPTIYRALIDWMQGTGVLPLSKRCTDDLVTMRNQINEILYDREHNLSKE